MAIRLRTPSSIFDGWYWVSQSGRFACGFLAHTLQCDQRWIFLLRWRRRVFGYRTHGDASPNLLTYEDAGWYWPWRLRICSGRR